MSLHPLFHAIQARGFKVFTMAVERGEWARVLRALLTRDYWTRRCTADPAYTWYLAKLKATIDAARLTTGSEQVRRPGHHVDGRADLASHRGSAAC